MLFAPTPNCPSTYYPLLELWFVWLRMGCFSGSHIIEINAWNFQISFQVLKRPSFSPRIISQNPFKIVSKWIMELAINWTMALNLKTLNLYLYKATHMNPQHCPSIFPGQRETDLLAEGKKRKHKPQNHSMHFNIEIIETSRERSWWQNFYHTDGQLAPWVHLAKHFDHETFVAWMASCYIEPPASC